MRTKVPLTFLFQSCHSSSISCSGARPVKCLSCLPRTLPPSAPGKGAGQSMLSPSFVPWALPWKGSLWPACTGHQAAARCAVACLLSVFGDQNAGLPLPQFPRANPQAPLECFAILDFIRHVTSQDLYPWLVTGGEEALLLRATLNCSENRPSPRSV